MSSVWLTSSAANASYGMVLLNLLAAVALLLWGIQLIRKALMRVYGEHLKTFIEKATGNAWRAMGCGLAITALVQSSTATLLMVGSFASQGFMGTRLGLMIMLGADIGSSALTQVFALNVQAFSPLMIVAGVFVVLRGRGRHRGRIGRVFIGLGLMLMSLQAIMALVRPWSDSMHIQQWLAAWQSQAWLHWPLALALGAGLAVLCYSSMAAVLISSSLVGGSVLGLETGLALMLGANIGNGLLGYGSSLHLGLAARRIALGHLAMKGLGVTLALCLLPSASDCCQAWNVSATSAVLQAHLAFNMALAGIGAVALSIKPRWYVPRPRGGF
jgi:phosphate:Na+ symporter